LAKFAEGTSIFPFTIPKLLDLVMTVIMDYDVTFDGVVAVYYRLPDS